MDKASARVDSARRSASLASLPHVGRSAWVGVSVLLGRGCEVTLADEADDGDSQDDHEGAGG